MKYGQLKTKEVSQTKQKPQRAGENASQENQSELQNALSDPQSATPADILRLQEKAGNIAVNGWLASNTVQREPVTDRQGILNNRISTAIQNARGSGQPLPPALREDLEHSFNTDFSGVRLHHDQNADALSRQISARAFTTGPDIFFRQGAFAPESQRGQQTLKHELTHVVQQGGRAPSGRLKLGDPDTAEEQQAARNAQSGGGLSSAGSSAVGSAIQRELDFGAIAAAFGGSVTEEMVKRWTAKRNAQKDPVISAILMEGRNIDEFDMTTLKLYLVDVAQIQADLNLSKPPEEQQSEQGFDPTIPMPKRRPPPPPRRHHHRQPAIDFSQPPRRKPPEPPMRAKKDTAFDPQAVLTKRFKPRTAPNESGSSQTRPPAPDPELEEGIKTYVSEQAALAQIPSGSLLKVMRDVGRGNLGKLGPEDVDEVITLIKARDFDALAAKGVSINHIVTLTGGYERQGVGSTRYEDPGIKGTLKSGFIGSTWGEGRGRNSHTDRAFGAADMMQNSWLLPLISGAGAGVKSLEYLNMLGSDHLHIGNGAGMGTELAGGIMSNSVTAIQGVGALTQSGANWARLHQARSFHDSISGSAMWQSGTEASYHMLNGLLGLTNAGLGFGQAGVTFKDRLDNPSLSIGQSTAGNGLGTAKYAVAAGASGLSLAARSTKAGLANSRKKKILDIKYVPSRHLTDFGRRKEQSVFPRLKAALADAQGKKASGQALDITNDSIQTLGNVTQSVGYGIGGDIGSKLKLAGMLTNLGASIAKPIVNKIKNYFTVGRKFDQSGYRNIKEYRQDRMRSLDSTDETGKKTTLNVRVSDVAKESNDVYNDLLTSGNAPKSVRHDLMPELSISRLLHATAEFQDLNTVFTTDDPAVRKEAIKNILLARNATF